MTKTMIISKLHKRIIKNENQRIQLDKKINYECDFPSTTRERRFSQDE